IFIKPHPSEVRSLRIYEKLDVTLLDEKLCGEYVVDQIKPRFLIGFCSGLLLTSYYLYGTEYFYLTYGDFGLDERMDLDSTVLSLFDESKRLNLLSEATLCT